MPKNLLNDMLPHGHYPAVTTSLAAPPSVPNCCLSTLSWEVKEHNPPVFLFRIYHVLTHLSRTFFRFDASDRGCDTICGPADPCESL